MVSTLCLFLHHCLGSVVPLCFRLVRERPVAFSSFPESGPVQHPVVNCLAQADTRDDFPACDSFVLLVPINVVVHRHEDVNVDRCDDTFARSK